MDTEKIPTTRPVHYEDDFDFILHLYSVLVDSEGNVTRREELPFPKYDFTATFRTGCTARSFTASCIGGVCTNCYDDAGRVHIVADGHGLGPGSLRCKLTCELPDEVFPDGTRRMVVPENLNIELTKEKGAYPSTMEAEVLLPYIKGDKGDAFTYSDFTEEQIAELQRPATEAAQRADENEAVRQANEEQRIKSETARTSAYKEIAAEESRRVKAEQVRAGAEERRRESEERRESDESLRRSAEQNRTEHEQSRQDAEVLRQTQETQRRQAEEARQGAFEEAQTQRAAEFSEAEGQRAQTFMQKEQERDAEFAGYGAVINAKQDALTTSDDLRIADNVLSLTPMAKKRLFIDLWNTACGTHGKYDPANAPDAEHPFYLNELWLTYEEAVAVYQAGAISSTSVSKMYWCKNIRTNLPPNLGGQAYGETAFSFECLHLLDYSDIEVLNLCSPKLEGTYKFRLSPTNKKGTDNVIANALKLRKIIGIISLNYSNLLPHGVLYYLPLLEDFKLCDLDFDLDIKGLPKVNATSLRYIVDEAKNGTKTITITVHPDVYAKLTGDTTNAAAAALTADELAQWQAVLTAAAAKNISFATV